MRQQVSLPKSVELFKVEVVAILAGEVVDKQIFDSVKQYTEGLGKLNAKYSGVGYDISSYNLVGNRWVTIDEKTWYAIQTQRVKSNEV